MHEAQFIIRRRKPFSDGVYVKGTVEGTRMIFTTDTGATKTILSEKTYRTIPHKRRPSLTKTLKELGKAIINIEIGPIHLQKELIIADIDEEGLLEFNTSG